MDEENQKSAFKNLKIITEMLDREGVRYWLDAGTLLGIYRDGTLEHEHDTDIGVFVDDFETIDALRDEMAKKFDSLIGRFIYYPDYPIITSWGNDKGVVHGDILYWYKVPDTRLMYCHGSYLPFSMPERFFDKFIEMDFRGYDDDTLFTIPAKTKEYLKYYYGKQWDVPMSGVGYNQIMFKMADGKLDPYPVNEPIPEILAFRNKMINCGLNWRKPINMV